MILAWYVESLNKNENEHFLRFRMAKMTKQTPFLRPLARSLANKLSISPMLLR